ncbi:hypothetical protein [Sphingomonas sp. 28-63-12]|uniref:hypothetical protein n=1 Tax=Sphingomonas sp. 28-63-12 TaxID=1970434 RepID=UPI000BCB8C3E|nr:MAG: hypothetical protein B7Y47_04050 [Sphingomonas sp. 28-63-12]
MELLLILSALLSALTGVSVGTRTPEVRLHQSAAPAALAAAAAQSASRRIAARIAQPQQTLAILAAAPAFAAFALRAAAPLYQSRRRE